MTELPGKVLEYWSLLYLFLDNPRSARQNKYEIR